MGARAAEAALREAGLAFADIGCLVCTSGTREQALPSTAALIQQELGGVMSGIPAFDIDATCLSFVAGLDRMYYLVRHSAVRVRGLSWRQPLSVYACFYFIYK
ncbi:3-oxoacyl-[acyl-carrier-protein] synthase 3 [compost metagenome]